MRSIKQLVEGDLVRVVRLPGAEKSENVETINYYNLCQFTVPRTKENINREVKISKGDVFVYMGILETYETRYDPFVDDFAPTFKGKAHLFASVNNKGELNHWCFAFNSIDADKFHEFCELV